MAGGLHDDDDLSDLHEINVTPFIDVMLVLLIVFMVAAPLATVDINVDLPAARGAASERPDQPVWLTLAPDLRLSLGDTPVIGPLSAALDAVTGGDRDTRIFLRADQSVSYGEVMNLMNSLRDAGYVKIAMVGLDGAAAAPEAAAAPAPAPAAAPAGVPAAAPATAPATAPVTAPVTAPASPPAPGVAP